MIFILSGPAQRIDGILIEGVSEEKEDLHQQPVKTALPTHLFHLEYRHFLNEAFLSFLSDLLGL